MLQLIFLNGRGTVHAPPTINFYIITKQKSKPEQIHTHPKTQKKPPKQPPKTLNNQQILEFKRCLFASEFEYSTSCCNTKKQLKFTHNEVTRSL